MSKARNDEENESFLTNFYYNNKILIWILIIVIAFILIMKFINTKREDVTPVKEEIKLVISNKNNVMVGIGNTINLNVDINVINAVINWSSADTNIARVSNGNVTGVNYGKTKITASYIDGEGNKYTDSCDVTVVEGNPNVNLNNISFPEGDLYMPINKEYQLNLILNPTNALISDKKFISSNESVASVTQDGLVKSHKAGYTRVIATVNNIYQTAIDIYVNSEYNKSEIVISPTSISFNADTRKIKIGTKEKLNYSISPSNADVSKLTWESNEPSIVSVDQLGYITARSEGETIVTVKGVNGQRADIIVEVYNDIISVTDIVLNSTVLNIEAGKTVTIAPTIVPSNASNQALSYYSLAPDIASVAVNGSGNIATISALKKGSTYVVVRSGNIEKRILVNVTGEANNSEIEEDGNNLPTTIVVRSNKNNLAKTYEEAKKIPVPGAATVTVKMSTGVGSIKYCYNKYGSSLCTPTYEREADTTIMIPSGAIYVLRIKKYDYRGNEITSTSTNYINGVLNYYVNTESDVPEEKHYTVTGAYELSNMAMSLPSKIGDKVTVTVDDSTRHLSVCSATNSTCTPTIRVSKSYTFTISKEGTTRIYISEFDHASGEKIGTTQIYYAYVKPTSTNNTTNTNTSTDSTTTTTDSSVIKVSKLSVYNDSSIGKYLSAYVESDLAFSTVRFCYKTVTKGATGTCNLDINGTTVALHDGSTYFHPKEENKTFYGTLGSTKSKTLLFDLDGLDSLYATADTNKDVILEFSVKTSKGFYLPVKIRINMTKKNGTESYWNSTFIK